MITGQAGLEETVRAVNEASLKHYIAKPWEKDELVKITRNLLTEYVLEETENPMMYMQVLDAERIADHIRKEKDVTDN